MARQVIDESQSVHPYIRLSVCFSYLLPPFTSSTFFLRTSKLHQLTSLWKDMLGNHTNTCNIIDILSSQILELTKVP